ncbi:hypothetical protein M0R45_006809 [Rubus argutus]|uniref:Uncharacterized protein n=1 Tax=Rubus argutus TaxID=59490 RepID=A0AAW1YRL2_RUBAR
MGSRRRIAAVRPPLGLRPVATEHRERPRGKHVAGREDGVRAAATPAWVGATPAEKTAWCWKTCGLGSTRAEGTGGAGARLGRSIRNWRCGGLCEIDGIKLGTKASAWLGADGVADGLRMGQTASQTTTVMGAEVCTAWVSTGSSDDGEIATAIGSVGGRRINGSSGHDW